MKLTVFLILVAVGGAFAGKSYSQTKMLNLNMRDATVKEVLNSIEEQSEFSFLYSENLIDVNREVSVNIKNQKIDQVLNDLFEGTNVEYVIKDRFIVLTDSKTENEFVDAFQQKSVSGTVTDESGQPLPGVTVVVAGTTTGTVTNANGSFSLAIPPEAKTLQFSFVGMRTQEVPIEGRTTFTVVMEEETIGIDEVVAIGYGTQKKSDITGTVASLPEERLEMVPNTSIAQAIQGAIPGIQVNTNSAGATPNNTSIMIRGRNSIKASNDPLIVVDGFPYSGQLGDINPNDIKSVEILKDASSAAIYGSRGANGVILVTTKLGTTGKQTIAYDGYYAIQEMINYPDLLDGEEFYHFKLERDASTMTQTEKNIYDNKSWPDWKDLALRNGQSQQHNISVSGGTEKTKYFIAGNVLETKGLAINDNYLRLSNRINLETKITDWLAIGTRTFLSYTDESGIEPDFSRITWINPLTKAYEDDGSIAIYPDAENPNTQNPLQAILVNDIDKSYQIVSNNFLKVDLPFVPGLQYTINAGVRLKFTDDASYWARDTQPGFENRGRSSTNRAQYSNLTVENILSYNRAFDKHNLFITGLYSYEGYEFTSNQLSAQGFPHDILDWYSAAQAELTSPSYGYSKTDLISQMLRINYTYDNRYLFTLTGRRDGYSGFGSLTKWGQFPSLAVGWNIANESFFTNKDMINTLKIRASWGKNGNQAVGAYETITRLSSEDWVSGPITFPGYAPVKLGEDNLGWESTETVNLGLDFGLFSNRINGDLNVYRANTTDLLLNRTISAVHGVTEITQNIGKTRNLGLEAAVNSTNINTADFKWTSLANLSFIKNEIVSLYGFLNEEGDEIDDVGNSWFIGQPIRVNYDHEVIGVWQLNEAEEAAKYGSQPGDVKLNDLDGDYDIDADDRKIIGQRDPKFLWGLTNTIEYNNFILSFFIHGVHGVTRVNPLLIDDVWTDITRNTTKKNWWTEDNPTNDFYANRIDANQMGGGIANYYENASFIRFKDITLAYNVPANVLRKIGLNKLRFYLTGRNLFTITKYGGMDPELNSQRDIPLQREYVIGLNIGL